MEILALYLDTIGEKTSTIIDRDILFLSAISDEQKLQLQEIAAHCAISKIIEGDIKVRSFLFRNGETEKKLNYSNDEITVVWKPEFCQHSIRCFKQLPEVFNPQIRKWINPNGASTEKIIEQVNKCPSGALTFFYMIKKIQLQQNNFNQHWLFLKRIKHKIHSTSNFF